MRGRVKIILPVLANRLFSYRSSSSPGLKLSNRFIRAVQRPSIVVQKLLQLPLCYVRNIGFKSVFHIRR